MGRATYPEVQSRRDDLKVAQDVVLGTLPSNPASPGGTAETRRTFQSSTRGLIIGNVNATNELSSRLSRLAVGPERVPGFPATIRWSMLRVRLSAKKGAWSLPEPPTSTGNPG
jgi:hypothetical protein